ncbi:MAG: hypothetical protein SFU53_16110 [Terrimicrobiaceae bacterium]|nr:hypothetical protein [Terrimicrobiaceae bacterium]
MFSRILTAAAAITVTAVAGDFNAIVLKQIESMPQGGGYATTRAAHDALQSSVRIESGGVRIRPELSVPSYCSGATYLVFLKAVGELQRRGQIRLSRETWEALRPQRLADGHGVWGRWNANGPGTARLVHELEMGRSFTSFEEARPGDFLKIFWTDAVGKKERGHLVVYLGTETIDGVEHVRFWSSNKPAGFGQKSVPRTEVARALFTRIEAPERLERAAGLPKSDSYLAGLLQNESSFAEALRLSGVPRG